MRFRDVMLNEPFDWIGPTGASFFDRCFKTGKRTYQSLSSGRIYKVGSINATVYHVGLIKPFRRNIGARLSAYVHGNEAVLMSP